MTNDFYRNKPRYNDDADFITNSESYYKDLARKQKLIKLLAEKIWKYENTLKESLESIEKRLTDYIAENDQVLADMLQKWDDRIANLDKEVSHIFVEWLNDGTLEEIINHDVLGNKADQSELDKTNARLAQTNKREVIAHRGFSYLAPENTIPAFELAYLNKADSLEFDMHVTSDGKVVIIHDDSVDRTTDGSGLVREKTLEQINNLDAGSWFSDYFRGVKVPTFDDCVPLFSKFKKIYPEIKGYRSRDDILLMLHELNKVKDKTGVVLCSFYEPDLTFAIEKGYTGEIGYLVSNRTQFERALSFERNYILTSVCAHKNTLLENKDLVDECFEKGIPLSSWIVNEQRNMVKLNNLGIFKIISDNLKGGR